MAKEQNSENARAQHGDRRLEEKRGKYGDLANLTVEQLQQRAEEQGIQGRSGMRKEELLEALSGGSR
ncbi:Rho termination factor N-terminal domain-containing protein [Thermobifida halotolerans]|uniref:Rho termination factor N-terminal domain-containing protein n=1 Tax=Thermobifida halotolerans TaxID=483545 RepID=A0A399G9E4_9ACTN|nr:Rho termination factor N-terminal domain-containing protein [Thermobifida halotolerans]UOE21186.1 Rho termination factor N-terminal domain-containing protein [Thermobifida halotolerans]